MMTTLVAFRGKRGAHCVISGFLLATTKLAVADRLPDQSEGEISPISSAHVRAVIRPKQGTTEGTEDIHAQVPRYDKKLRERSKRVVGFQELGTGESDAHRALSEAFRRLGNLSVGRSAK
jgi:hypothetical protein